jgi:serine/threonine protein phosphatase 1
MVFYYVENDMLFVHGGIDPSKPLHLQSKETLIWDRSIISYAQKQPIPGFKKVFIGHTTTTSFGDDPKIKDCMVPLKFNNLIMLDCGAGWRGRLAIMDIDTEEYWVSEIQHPEGIDV